MPDAHHAPAGSQQLVSLAEEEQLYTELSVDHSHHSSGAAPVLPYKSQYLRESSQLLFCTADQAPVRILRSADPLRTLWPSMGSSLKGPSQCAPAPCASSGLTPYVI